MILKPWQFILLTIASYLNKEQQAVIEYRDEEIRILKEKLGKKRLLLNNAQKRRLAAAAAKVGRDALGKIGALFSPETLLRWHQSLVAKKYDGSAQRGKRGPTKASIIRDLVLKMAEENPDWGYSRIHGELKELGHKISKSTVRKVMLDHGLLHDPDHPKKTTWKTFLQSHFECISCCDFFTVEAWGLKGLTRYLIFFVIELHTRRVEIVGIHADPCETQMIQYARNLTDPENGFLKGKRFLIHDRDPLYTKKFRATLRAAGVRSLKLPPRAPNLNPWAEAFVGTIKKECLNKMILFGEGGVRHAVSQYVEYYHKERVHCTLGRRIIQSQEPSPPPVNWGTSPESAASPGAKVVPHAATVLNTTTMSPDSAASPGASPPSRWDSPATIGEVRCRERLGGLLKSYYRQAA